MAAMKIAVVGAGIAGLTAAVALQRAGHEVTVLEKRPDISPGAGITLWPNALAALDDVGLGAVLRASGGRVTGGAVLTSSGRQLRKPDPERFVSNLGEPLVVIQRDLLRDVFTAVLEPGTVQFGREVTVTGGLDADLVIGADGISSSVARELNGRLNRRYAGYTAWRGVASADLDEAVAGETLGHGYESGHLPMGDGRTYWFLSGRHREQHAADGVSEKEKVRIARLIDGWAGPLPSLVEATPIGRIRRTGLYDREPARHWTSDRVALIGDAVHPMRPHLGQGGCQAIEDAVTLALLVGDGSSPLPEVLAAYEALRRPRAESIARESRAIGRVLNVRPHFVVATGLRASRWVPDQVLMRHLRSIASGAAWEKVRPEDARMSGPG